MDATQLMAKIGDSLSAGRVFGDPIERDGCTLIPVAYVLGGGGSGKDQGAPAHGDRPARGPGEGGGFGMICWPIGAYVIKGGEAKFVPAVDQALLIFASSLAASRLIKAIRGRGRRRRSPR
jgi:uncharacterized spore protein YtfJ